MYEREWQYLYHDKRWIKGRLIHLAKNPLCVYCLQVGITKAADIVDHIQAHKGNEELFFDTSNWQSLCKHCHDSIKAREEARGYAVGCDVDGLPLDRNHFWNK